MASNANPVVYIGGWGRSGSTLLAVMLAQVPGVVSPGELRFIWDRGVLRNELCGCGSPFSSCSFWKAVGAEAYGSWSQGRAREMLRLEDELQRLRSVPALWSDSCWRKVAGRYAEYHEQLSALYEALRVVAGASVVVDSTKDVPYAYVLSRAPRIDMRVLHLVRDSRAVAYSWTRNVKRPEVLTTESFMDRYHPARSAYRWAMSNALFAAFGRNGLPYRRIRYETLVTDPLKALADTLELAGLDPVHATRLFDDQGRVQLEATHTVSGNPVRFATGRLELALDDEWRRAMPRWEKSVVTALTFPTLRAYGYLGASGDSCPGASPIPKCSRPGTA